MNKIIIEYKKNISELSLLAKKYGTDKGSPKQGEQYHKYWECQPYTDFYEKFFSLQKNEIKNVFECGIGNKKTMGEKFTPGASLKMWKDYFKNADIYGADIDQETIFNEERIHTFLMDQANEESVKKVFSQINKEFDLIIDDGLHSINAAKNFFDSSFKYLKNNGFFIIEDVVENIIDVYIDWADSTGVSYFIVKFDPNANKTCLLVFNK